MQVIGKVVSGRLTPKHVLSAFVMADEEGGTTHTQSNDLIQGAFRIQPISFLFVILSNNSNKNPNKSNGWDVSGTPVSAVLTEGS